MRVDLPQPLGPRMQTCSPAADLQGDVLEGGAFAAHYGDVVEGEERGVGGLGGVGGGHRRV